MRGGGGVGGGRRGFWSRDISVMNKINICRSRTVGSPIIDLFADHIITLTTTADITVECNKFNSHISIYRPYHKLDPMD